MADLSARLTAVLRALPLREGMRVLEVGCGSGALARAIAAEVGASGSVLGVDRSPTAIQAAERASDHGSLDFRVAAVERFRLMGREQPFDLVVAIRVGALDGRHPELEAEALERLRAATVPGASLYIDRGDPLERVALH
ncbi:SAM-dependent methyltransferase [Agrococcus carbonis]|uniref:Methyltransferase domain-containing protein n=1 Tax=Agrococcus carbonis TaxID=684552 RepID=A0A1H1NWS0_9MICO|nr:methyltransferase domain-containing protein [Agrococcus carbonis]SDS03240.1 Methyltransferase domain-containing protein [Agrococcus carbonis]